MLVTCPLIARFVHQEELGSSEAAAFEKKSGKARMLVTYTLSSVGGGHEAQWERPAMKTGAAR